MAHPLGLVSVVLTGVPPFLNGCTTYSRKIQITGTTVLSCSIGMCTKIELNACRFDTSHVMNCSSSCMHSEFGYTTKNRLGGQTKRTRRGTTVLSNGSSVNILIFESIGNVLRSLGKLLFMNVHVVCGMTIALIIQDAAGDGLEAFYGQNTSRDVSTSGVHTPVPCFISSKRALRFVWMYKDLQTFPALMMRYVSLDPAISVFRPGTKVLRETLRVGLVVSLTQLTRLPTHWTMVISYMHIAPQLQKAIRDGLNRPACVSANWS